MIIQTALLLLHASGISHEIDLPAGLSPLNNPLKGFASYCDPGSKLLTPASMAYEYGNWKDLEPEEGKFAFKAWEDKSWDKAPASGKDLVLRVVMDYPGEPSGVPDWVIRKGVKMTRYTEFGGGITPNYEDPNLVKPLLKFIQAFGDRYDKNDRVAYIQVGFLGHWGEWHTYPHENLFASTKVQSEVIESLKAAFPNKPLMARNASYPSCQLPWLGFHDDMIPSDTFGKDDWEFLPAIEKGGVTQNWKVAPIGGEMVPGAAKQYLGPDWSLLRKAVKDAHFTWIGPYCPACAADLNAREIERADELIRSLGYSFKLEKAIMPDSATKLDPVKFTIQGVNEGVAPLYAHWTPTFALIRDDGLVQKTFACESDPWKWLPGSFETSISARVDAPEGHYRIGFGIVDPARKTARIGFANTLKTVNGFAVLGQISVVKPLTN